MLRKVWRSIASVQLSIYLLFLAASNLGIAAGYLKWMPDTFRPLNKMPLPDWWSTYATADAWWIVTLLIVLSLLGVNTAACTVDRLCTLWPRRFDYGRQRFLVLLSPSLMHIFFLLALSGHALSLFNGVHKDLPLVQGDTIPVGNALVQVEWIQPRYWDNPLLKNPLKQCTIGLTFHIGSKTVSRELRFLKPFILDGWSYHLDANPNANPGEPPQLFLQVRKDPGLTLILIGGAAMSILMGWYFFQLSRLKNNSASPPKAVAL
ncbi:MAG TPA: hypothetical protein PKJ77_04105 [Thermodesulfobacteriota bacterium]|nr:hypothetical protein [Thermodesulfobacteriota bacterium]